ncbi:MAG TPA: polysaccharide biosynthesis tyrosine autokinase, partial [Flavobacterium sp.]|nr:polysaccharide biosynthesis tyrosine autokinase [Flavobacterium sp.]
TTSLVFNWGGVSDQVQSLSSTLQSRSHNELVVDRLNFYIDYLQEGEYYVRDAYGDVPFYIDLQKPYGQLLGKPIKIVFIDETTYEIRIDFEESHVSLYNYSDYSISSTAVAPGHFVKRYKIGEQVALPFMRFKLELHDNPGFYKNAEYIIRFNNFDETVARYRDIKTVIDAKAGSLMTLSHRGPNKQRMVDYLNATVNTLIKSQLDRKNQFAKNTIVFIDSTLTAMDELLKQSENEIKAFSRDKNIFDIESGGSQFSERFTKYDVERDLITRKINYLNSLSSYLERNTDYSKLPAPSVAGIEDPNIIRSVSRLIDLSTRRSEMAYAVKNDKMFRDFDIEIESLRKVLLNNISSAKISSASELAAVNRNLSQVEGSISQLPGDKQELLQIQRKYNLRDNIINIFMEKRNEAEIVRAANLSDIHFIDSAKDTGGGLVGPNTRINYILAFFLGLLIPFLFVLGIFFLENAILNTDEIARLTSIPLIGIIGVKHNDTNLSVIEKPKSALAESFRAIRSSLQFLYKKQDTSGTKTLMLTSSISGEGKTFCSINIATVFAMSEKKTVIVGVDLRKPKIFDDFKIRNDIGVVNYLIGQKSIDEVIQKTHIPFLDVVTSGPIPPNPSELIIGESMREFINELKNRYDYIILDTPPVGLVSDAVELAQYADVTLYIMRQNYTKKDMVTLLNNRHKRGELNNVSIVFNGYENKAKYGYAYGYGYGYSYASYSDGYHEDDKKESFLKRVFKGMQTRVNEK